MDLRLSMSRNIVPKIPQKLLLLPYRVVSGNPCWLPHSKPGCSEAKRRRVTKTTKLFGFSDVLKAGMLILTTYLNTLKVETFIGQKDQMIFASEI